MTVQMILAPLFVQVLLTFVVGFSLAGLRTGALTRREIKPRDIDLRQPNWPPRTTQFANCFRNQFELPVLFYVLTILAMITRHADFLFVVLAWIFVLTRLVHAYIHVTSNNLRDARPLVRLSARSCCSSCGRSSSCASCSACHDARCAPCRRDRGRRRYRPASAACARRAQGVGPDPSLCRLRRPRGHRGARL